MGCSLPFCTLAEPRAQRPGSLRPLVAICVAKRLKVKAFSGAFSQLLVRLFLSVGLPALLSKAAEPQGQRMGLAGFTLPPTVPGTCRRSASLRRIHVTLEVALLADVKRINEPRPQHTRGEPDRLWALLECSRSVRHG